MLLAVGFVPAPPLLVPALAQGAGEELDRCRRRCRAVLVSLARTAPERLLVVADGPPGRYASGDHGSLAGFGLPPHVARVSLPGAPSSVARPGSAAAMPPSLAVAAWLLTDARWTTPVEAHTLPPSSTKDDVRALADALTGDGADVAILAVGDGSARLDPKAPGSLDPDAVEWQEAATRALATADLDAILALDPEQACAHLASGRVPWQVAAAAVQHDDAEWHAELLADERPYGVAYLTAAWTRA